MIGATMPPLSIYIHVPYCVRKCPYCDFYSTEGSVAEKPYLEAIIKELGYWRHQLQDDSRPIHSIFFGGGTPSLLQGESIGLLLEHVRTLWPLDPSCEISLESNPESCTPEKLDQWLEHGVNRLSLGIQAFAQQRLITLQRPHTLVEARESIKQARQAGFNNLNLDLIYATHDHTLDQWQKELAEAMAWQPQHLSCYCLTIEQSTPFGDRHQQGTLTTLDEDAELSLFTTTRKILEAGGWQAYEISNFAKPGFECRHNLNYWHSGDYLGIGPAAHGRLSILNNSTLQTIRHTNRATHYFEKQQNNGSSLLATHTSSPTEAGNEALLMGLRLKEGVNRQTYKALCGFDLLTQHQQILKIYQEDGLLNITPDHVHLTEKATPLLDAILSRLFCQ